MKNILCLFCLLAIIVTHAQTTPRKNSAPLTEAAPNTAGISAERLTWLDNMLQKSVDDGDIPGVVALVARKGKIVYHKAFGIADPASRRKQEKDDIFRIASQTKAITSTAVMMLWEQGKFKLDDPVSNFIPEFKNPQVLESFHYSDTSYTTRPASKEITIRHLLTHTSGVGYGIIDSDERMKMIYRKARTTDLFTTGDTSIGNVIKRIAKLPLHHDPGAKYTYGMGLDVLAYFVEIISGMPFDRFLREKLFDPIGMKDTWFYLPENKAGRLAAVQQKVDGKWTVYPTTFYDVDFPVKGAKRFFSGGAGLSSTAKDYATFLQMYLNGGIMNGVRILSRTTIATMMANQVGDLFGSIENYGLAFGVLTEEGVTRGGSGSAGTFQWGGYFNTQYFADPKEGIIGILMKQTQGPVNDNTGWKFKQIVGALVDD